ncbi:hypothetical protein DFA_06868 [Cavenderia fasciculata]|uniref:Uncharacterized protein n=1 Tax=Cavenderia fasciculata TaxID=261658 RepID=F4PWW5_CACFS|nr:uncharacterized protein DFA_06868 [Cavenderia fasciculata]EGG19768.1 hypothetical protein DFA_06868 [Cavenderia fasciculata]|eukprot:XP_004358114.1 hypothetical protein DFA_06868 [Cavenderia fasciculata]
MEQVVSNELDYRPLLVSEPEYEYTRLFPQSGTTYTTVSAGGNDAIFEIPPSKAYNFGKSWFQFSFTLPVVANFGCMQYDYYPASLDDYKALRKVLIDSTIQTPNIHNYNWVWIEEFGDGCYNFNQDNVVTGIDLNLGEQKWDFIGFFGVATNLTHQSTVKTLFYLSLLNNIMKYKLSSQSIIKTIPIGGVIPANGKLYSPINLDFIPDVVTLKYYSVSKINNVVVEPIKLPQPPKYILGSDMFNQVSANILLCAPKNSGKTVVIKKILDECANRDTKVIIFCATVNNDASWLDTKRFNKKRNSFSFLYNTQSWKDTSASIRKGNLDYVLLFKNINDDTLKIIYEELSLTIPIELFKQIYQHATLEKYHFLYINRNGDFRKDFDQNIIMSRAAPVLHAQAAMRDAYGTGRRYGGAISSYGGPSMQTSLGGQQGEGFFDWLKKAHDFVKDNKLISRGAKALGDAGVPFVGKVGDVAGSLGYGQRRNPNYEQILN